MGIHGRGAGIRTLGLLLPKQTRYQAALHPEIRSGNDFDIYLVYVKKPT
jgi:hypothetical protein